MQTPSTSTASSRPIGDGFRAGIAKAKTFLAMGHLAFIPILIAYALLVAGNSLAFDYTYSNEAAPTAQAAAVSDLTSNIFLVFVAFVWAFTYAWMSRYALSMVDGTDTNLWVNLRLAVKPFMKAAVVAVPIFLICALAVVFIVPSFLVVGLAGSLPFAFLDRNAHPLERYASTLKAQLPKMMLVGLMAASIGVVTWIAFALEELARHNLQGGAQGVFLLPMWGAVAFSMVAAGIIASMSAAVYRNTDLDLMTERPVDTRPARPGP